MHRMMTVVIVVCTTLFGMAACSSDSDCSESTRSGPSFCDQRETADDGSDASLGDAEDGDSDAADVQQQATLPMIIANVACSPAAPSRHNLCDWLREADAVVYGTVQEMTLYEALEGGEVSAGPLESCDDEFGLRVTLSDVEPLVGEVGQDIEVHFIPWVLGGWMPYIKCDEEHPSRPMWKPDEASPDGTGPLDVGQRVGMTVDEHESGVLIHSDLFDPLFTERDDHLFLQNGSAFSCELLEFRVSELESLGFEEFRAEAATCADYDLASRCHLQSDVPCLDGEDCCPSGCAHLMGTAFDLEAQCRLEIRQDPVRFGCAPRPVEGGVSTDLLCTSDGAYAFNSWDSRVPHEQLDVVPCSELDGYAEGGPNLSGFDTCQ